MNRRLELEGALNFRDIGGYPTPSGPVRTGVVYRSDQLSDLTDGDLTVLEALGIRAVYDFRDDAEVERQPTRLPASVVTHQRLAIGDATVGSKSFIEQALDGELTQYTEEDASVGYQTVLTQHGDRFALLMESLAIDDALPAVFHCTAGKDRTGLAAALLLELLGVERDTILDDYELTNTYRGAHRARIMRPRFEARGIDIELFMAGIAAPRGVLAASLAYLDARFGSPTGYVRDKLGVRPEVIQRLRHRLLSAP